MEESTKTRLHQIEISAAVVLLLVSLISFFPKPGITGFVSVETKKQEIDISIANSQSYILTTNSQIPFYITTFKISGEVIGDGVVKAYLTNAQGQKILVYSNTIKKESGLGGITGMDKITGNAVGAQTENPDIGLIIEHIGNIDFDITELPKDEELNNGRFENTCIDSCFIDMLLQQDIAYELLFYVEEGTILNINEIEYTIRID